MVETNPHLLYTLDCYISSEGYVLALNVLGAHCLAISR